MKRISILLALGMASCSDSTATMATAMNDLSTAMASGDMAHVVAPGDMAMNGAADMAHAAGDMATMSVPGAIPDPGNMAAGADIYFDPPNGIQTNNNTPGNAVPEGIASNVASLDAWVTENMMTATHQADYFVFKTGNVAGTFVLGSGGICSETGSALLSKIDLWTVSGGQMQTPPVSEWLSDGTTCIKGSGAVAANTVYLIGFIGNGTNGNYSA